MLPQLGVVVVEQNKAARTADIEWGWSVGECLLDDIKNARVGYWRSIEKTIIRVTIRDCGEERGRRRHLLAATLFLGRQVFLFSEQAGADDEKIESVLLS
jgi:hypothetical protein